MGTDFFTTLLDTIVEVFLALLRIQYSAIFSLIDAIQAFSM